MVKNDGSRTNAEAFEGIFGCVSGLPIPEARTFFAAFYENEFDDARLIYRSDNHLNYFGPTKLKLSLVYVLGTKLRQR